MERLCILIIVMYIPFCLIIAKGADTINPVSQISDSGLRQNITKKDTLNSNGLAQLLKNTVIPPNKSKDSIINLDNVYIYADNKTSTAEKTVIFPENSLIRRNSSILGVLNDLMLPGLEVNTVLQTSSIYGKPIKYQINGVPKSNDAILAISPTDIYKIEYTEMVSIKEASSGIGGVINIILKDKHTGGGVYESLYSALTTGMINESAGFSYNNKYSQFSLSYNMQWRKYKNSYSDSQQEFIADQNNLITRTSQGIYGNLNMCLHDLEANYTYIRRNSTTLSVTARYYFGPWNRHSKNINNENSESASSVYYVYKTINQPYSVPSLDLYFKRNFGNHSVLEFNSTFATNLSNNDRYQNNVYEDGMDVLYSNSTHSRKYNIINELNWIKRFEKQTLKIGIQYIYTDVSNDYMTIDCNTYSKLKDHSLFTYVEYVGAIKKLSYTIGSGLYYTNTESEKKKKLQYLKNYSTIRWMLSSIGNFSFRGVLKYSPQFPRLSSMEEVLLKIDDLIASAGNPKLKPSTRFESETYFSFNLKSFSSYIRTYTKHVWNPIFSIVHFENPIYVLKMINGIADDQYSIGISFQYRSFFTDDFSIGASLNGTFSFYKSSWGAFRKKYMDFSVYGNAFISYKNWTLATSANSPNKYLSGELISTIGAYNNISLSYSWKSLNISVIGSWLGIKKGDYKKYQSVSTISPYNIENILNDNSNTVGISITYRFEFGRKGIDAIRNNNKSTINKKEVNLIN